MMDFLPHFTLNQIIVYVAGMSLIVSACFLFFLSRYRLTALILLISGGFFLRLFMMHLDPFVNMWDEQVHTLVAKNMMSEPFKPMLYKEPVLDFDYKMWNRNHIWLHKQPLFLWQMALSMKLFGVSPEAARLPSMLLSTLMILLIYLIGKRWRDEETGFIGALFFTCGHYMLELVAGRYHTDHNDMAFIFYVTASLWAYTEYHFSRKRWWLPLIGLLAAMAVLNKWLTGLFVFLFWGIALLSDKQIRTRLKNYYDLAVALLVTCILSLPWQIYTHLRFPAEAKWESEYNTMHFFEAVEGHGGDFWYHFSQLNHLYGPGTKWFIIVGSVFLWFSVKHKPIRNALIASTLFVFLFFGLAKTKMPAFTLIIAGSVYLALGNLAATLHRLLRIIAFHRLVPSLIMAGVVILIAFSMFNHNKIAANHTYKSQTYYDYFPMRKRDNEIFKRLPEILPEGKYVVLNARAQEHLQIMFETDYTAYDYLPDSAAIQLIKDQGYRVAVFNNFQLPSYITADTAVFIIESEMYP